jgi:plasmid stability protein
MPKWLQNGVSLAFWEIDMPNLSVKEVPEAIAFALRERAARNHRSLQGELMAILEAAVKGEAPRKLSVAEIAAMGRARFPQPVATAGRAVDLIREDRDAR